MTMTPRSPGIKRAGRITREVLLSCGALLGVICIVLTVLAFTSGYSLIMFRTGSMAPTIPAGSLALVQTVDAADIEVGDVVTVDRPGQLPITHRVTSISPSTSDAARTLTMRGDANDVDDPLPYDVAEVRAVRGSVPHLAHVVSLLGEPWMLGILTLLATGVVTWAFWPRNVAGSSEGIPDHDDNDDEDASMQTAERAAPSVLSRVPAVAPALILAVATTAGLGVVGASAAPAAAASSVLSITSDRGTGHTHRLASGETLAWHLFVDATSAPEDGDLEILLQGAGEEDLGLSVRARSCDEPWVESACAGDERELRPDAILAADGSWSEIWTAPTPAGVHPQLELTANPSPTADGAERMTVTVRANAFGETVDQGIDGGPELATTGGSPFGLIAGPVAVILGIVIAAFARSRRKRSLRQEP